VAAPRGVLVRIQSWAQIKKEKESGERWPSILSLYLFLFLLLLLFAVSLLLLFSLVICRIKRNNLLKTYLGVFFAKAMTTEHHVHMTDHSNTLLFEKITRLCQISVQGINQVFETAVQRPFPKGALLLKQGQVCHSIFFIEKGYVKTFIEKDGVEINTDFSFEGSFVTSLKSLRSGAPSETSIKVEEQAVIYEFDKHRLLELYAVSAEIESFGRQLLEQLLIAQEEHTTLFKMYSPTERYQYLRDRRPEMLQRVSLSQLASYLGVARETLSRIRKNKA
jgi:CRP-like cAMP-binding protein